MFGAPKVLPKRRSFTLPQEPPRESFLYISIACLGVRFFKTIPFNIIVKMVPPTGFEPATPALEVPCSNSAELRGHKSKFMEPGEGFEPPWRINSLDYKSSAISHYANRAKNKKAPCSSQECQDVEEKQTLGLGLYDH